ncbi:galactose oxidase/kelch repeat superfamily protein [Striga asiatica]|uniref:Galactose oxidase/kelch repeat superfamily protein n=1 Tax=Striga asiatica TaxID=4170 RepID=A0A5A7QGC7_STRAF|nr:galactose oxidase/kelch repeat superfamily protein [Striga asiatica]
MAPTFQTTYVVANIIVLINTKEKTIKKTSIPPGRLIVHPSLGRPLLLSSNKFVGASGRPDRFLFPSLSLSLKASNKLLPSPVLIGFESTLAALSLSLAVSGARFGVRPELGADGPGSGYTGPLDDCEAT